MFASTRRIPSYRLHKASGNAIVSMGSRVVYLGTYGSDESRQKYDRLYCSRTGLIHFVEPKKLS
jgi:hypothetical protein